MTIDSRYSHSRHAVCPNSRQCRFSSHRDSRPASSTPRCAFETDTISDAAGQTQPSLVRDVPAASDQTLRYIDDDGVFPGLHAVTNCNAFGVTHRESGAADTRLLALLQNASFLPLNRDEARSRGGMDGGESVADLVAQGSGSLEEVSATMSDDPVAAARQTLAWLQAGGELRSSPRFYSRRRRRGPRRSMTGSTPLPSSRSSRRSPTVSCRSCARHRCSTARAAVTPTGVNTRPPSPPSRPSSSEFARRRTSLRLHCQKS